MKKGMTLVEILLALALMAGVSMTAILLLDTIGRDVNEAGENIQREIDNIGAQGIIRNDLLYANDSFNFLHIESDGTNNTGTSFFDYDHRKMDDCSSNGAIKDICKRSFKLEFTNNDLESKPFYVIVTDNSKPVKSPVNPYRSFDQSTKTFKCVNFQQITTHQAGNQNLGVGETSWKTGNLILLNTINDYYDQTRGLNLKIAYLGVVGDNDAYCNLGQDLLPVSFDSSESVRFHSSYNLRNATGGNIISFTANRSREVFNNLPYTPAYPVTLFINPVRIIRYVLTRDLPNTENGMLRRSVGTLVGSGSNSQITFGRGAGILDNVRSLTFERDSIHTPLIRYTLEENK